ncbi:MAG: hypothetical protein KGL12_08955 [Rhodospirillales bacterium]|nr:hypothetical protein [Rhodospirillales bacterium]
MKTRLVPPRLLPLTSLALAALLSLKSVELVRAAVPAPPSPTPTAPAGKGVGVPSAQAAEAVALPIPLPSGAAGAVAPPSPGEQALLIDLRQRRRQLDARAQALDARAALIAAEEKQLAQRISDMQALQRKLEALDAQRRGQDEKRWQALVQVYQAMAPRDAARIFDALDMQVLLHVVRHMNGRKVAPILAAMQPEKARSLTDALAYRNHAQPASSPHPGG